MHTTTSTGPPNNPTTPIPVHPEAIREPSGAHPGASRSPSGAHPGPSRDASGACQKPIRKPTKKHKKPSGSHPVERFARAQGAEKSIPERKTQNHDANPEPAPGSFRVFQKTEKIYPEARFSAIRDVIRSGSGRSSSESEKAAMARQEVKLCPKPAWRRRKAAGIAQHARSRSCERRRGSQ